MALARPTLRGSLSEESMHPHEHVRLLPEPGHHGRKLKEGAPVLLKKRSSKWFILITVCVALFTDSFIYGVLVPVLPFLLRDRCHVRLGTEQLWTSALFAIFGAAILVGSPICGYIADHNASRQVPLLLGLPLLIASTILLALGTDVYILLVARLLAGISTAITWTVGLALVVDTVGKAEVGQWMGTAISSNSIGLVVSPLLGGIVYAQSGLAGVLGMMAGLIVLNTVLICVMVEKRKAEGYYEDAGHAQGVEDSVKPIARNHGASYDTFSTNNANTNTNNTTNPTNAIAIDAATTTTTADTPTSSPTSIHSTSSSIRLAALKASKHTNLPPLIRLIFSPRILASTYGVFTQFGILASFDAFLPLFVKRRFGWGSLGAGLIFLAIAIPALAGPLAGKISDKYGPRRVALAGCILSTPPLILLRVIGRQQTPGQVLLLCVLLVLIGLFLTLIISPLAADLSHAVDEMEDAQPGVFGEAGAYAQAYALFNCAMAAAEVVGPIVAGAVQDRYGIPWVAVVLGVWCASAAVPVWFFIGDEVVHHHYHESDGHGHGHGEEGSAEEGEPLLR